MRVWVDASMDGSCQATQTAGGNADLLTSTEPACRPMGSPCMTDCAVLHAYSTALHSPHAMLLVLVWDSRRALVNRGDRCKRG